MKSRLGRGFGQEDKVGETLARGLESAPQNGSLHYALGLFHIRLKQTAQGMPELKRAAELAPEDRIFAYGYAMGLYSKGGNKLALAFPQQCLAKHPNGRNKLSAGAACGGKNPA